MSSRELFSVAILVVLEHESDLFTDDPADAGGQTKYGISRRANPDVDVPNLTRGQAIELYWDRYWNRRGYDKLPVDVAVKTFDLAVNMGKRRAVTCLQRALRAAGLPVATDGILGPETWGAADAADTRSLLAALRSEAACDYQLIVAHDSSKRVFLNGWLNRAYS